MSDKKMTGILLTEEERKSTENKANELGMNLSQFIRKCIQEYGKTDTGKNITVNVNVKIKFEC